MDEDQSLPNANKTGPDAQWSKRGQEEIRLRFPPSTLEEEASESLLDANITGPNPECSKLDQQEIRQSSPSDMLEEEEEEGEAAPLLLLPQPQSPPPPPLPPKQHPLQDPLHGDIGLGLLPPLGEQFTKKQLDEYLTKLVNTIKGKSPSEEEAYAEFQLPDYLTILFLPGTVFVLMITVGGKIFAMPNGVWIKAF
jgi:uncharacterized protein YecE (DUF72 family)